MCYICNVTIPFRGWFTSIEFSKCIILISSSYGLVSEEMNRKWALDNTYGVNAIKTLFLLPHIVLPWPNNFLASRAQSYALRDYNLFYFKKDITPKVQQVLTIALFSRIVQRLEVRFDLSPTKSMFECLRVGLFKSFVA
ncbi:hypothetical protein QVD17_20186 [Tagetes erecta]|uniref:Uncharacterized protein n=1 Tax=Tagetes erecta TaxID=13708 RepID=A0AAD8NXP0_TARER|nr:hypothetical protein QVD17_20186 [Tagetes erecta]